MPLEEPHPKAVLDQPDAPDTVEWLTPRLRAAYGRGDRRVGFSVTREVHPFVNGANGRTVPGETPMARLKARLKAASER